MSRWVHDDERGATAVLVAASLFLLMGMAALTIDWGAGTNQRRQNQSGADFGALAGAQFANVDTACGGYANPIDIAACNATNEIIDVVDGNLGFAPGTLDWAGCVDTAVAATYPEFTSSGSNNGFASPLTDCVRFTENMQQVRVVIPTVDVDTTFGKVLGRDLFATSAFAHAQTDFREGSNVLPFALPASMSSSSHGCLKTSGNPNWDVCDGSVTGNFGSLDIRAYGNVTSNSSTSCTGSANAMLLSNIARGVDHRMETQPNPAGTQKVDNTLCPIFNAGPNSSLAQPGVGSNLDNGLTHGGTALSADGSPYKGRLYVATGGSVVRNAGGPNPITRLDNIPLWTYLITPAPGNCSGYAGTVNDPVEMQACLNTWTGGFLFTGAIKDTKRYAFVPEFHVNFSTPGTTYRYKAFRPVYLNTTYYGCSANSCNTVHTPGVADGGACAPNPIATCGTPGSWNSDLDAVTAFILQDNMLPVSALNPFPGADDEYSYALIR